MAQTKIIKRRIKAAKNISQITKAMQMVAAAKMKKAQNSALINRNYCAKLFEITRNLIKSEGDVDENGKELYVTITPNKGLCGSLLTNLTKKILEIINAKRENAFFINIGKKSEQTLVKYSSNTIASFDFGIGQSSYSQVIPVAKLTLDEFYSGKYTKVLVLYTNFINTLIQKPTIKQILPIRKEDIPSDMIDEKIEYLFEPDKNGILNYLIPYYIENQLFQLVLESYASEQSARMIAMKNATDNATEITKELTLIYNRARQMQITNEINDIATAQLAL
jgi:F-type H+-transporting ATPase subunit gamma